MFNKSMCYHISCQNLANIGPDSEVGPGAQGLSLNKIVKIWKLKLLGLVD